MSESFKSDADRQPNIDRSNEARHLESLIIALEDIIFEVDGNQVFKNVWIHDESLLFMPRENFLGKKIIDVMGPMAKVFTALFNNVLRTNQKKEIIYRHLDPNVNQWFRGRVKIVKRSAEPENCVLLLCIQDITEQHIAELALKETKERLERSNKLLDVTQELSRIAGWEYNFASKEVFWTKQAYMLFDVDFSFKPTVENTTPFFSPQSMQLIMDSARKSVQLREPYNFEMQIITSTGVHKWVQTIGIPVVKNNEVVSMQGVFMDISRKKETELELINAKNTAESASKAKSDFLSVMSHEIRTPLNGIIGIANLLKLDDRPDQNEYISNLIFSADHLLHLINDILDLAKIDNDKLELVVTEVNLPKLINNVKSQFKSLSESKGIQLHSNIDADIPKMVIADPIRLGQILNNLISNAIKFTDKGEVGLTLKLVALEDNKATIQFNVKDTGMGIPEYLHKTIFESFEQVQQSAYRKNIGTGLGLNITQRLIKLHNSEIFLDSSPGKGTEFYFNLSFDVAGDAQTHGDPGTPFQMSKLKGKLKGLDVLFVDDNEINVMVARKQLEYFGIEPHAVNNGKDALSLLSKNTYHVALLDLHMPEIDGFDMAEIIQEKYPNTHIIIFTADILMEVKEKLARMNIYDILSKPFAPEKMFEVLSNVKR